jgi:hypothetical protein
MKPTVSIVLALALSGTSASARSSEMLAFQGALGPARKAGASVSLVFRVYDAPVDGRLLAGPFRSPGQATADGEVSATIGPVATADFGSGPLWLEVGAAGVSIPRIRLEPVWYDAADGAGRLTGGRTLLAKAPRPRTASARAPESTTFLQNGPSSNRIDLVFVGDGYVESELSAYAIHCQNALNAFFAQEPYATYRNFFNVHVVNVISNESGVDNDPVQGISKDTALDAGFWCGGTERLLCVDVGKAYAAAAAAPQVDHVLVVANSTKYGGAGYTFADLATFAGGNGAASEVAIHETGHSLGNLADEYDYSDGSRFTGPEPLERNVSLLTAADMATAGSKWTLWLNDPGEGFGGLVSTYEGAYYAQFGIYRPTLNSKMRSLGVPFNLPSVEGMILEFYGIVHPLDGSTPPGTELNDTSVAFVDPVDPVGHRLDTQWYLDGAAIPGATQDTLFVASWHFNAGNRILSATVTDNTPLVRDEAGRAARMQESVAWNLQIHSATGVADRIAGVDRRIAFSIAPSPSTRGVTLRYRLPVPSRVRITAYDASGRAVATLAEGLESAGEHEALFNGEGRGSGLYFLRLDSEFGSVTRRALLIR